MQKIDRSLHFIAPFLEIKGAENVIIFSDPLIQEPSSLRQRAYLHDLG
jgi:hypothetical protein